ncbi:HDOD domain-containing protein [Marinobacter sp. M216]|uniref:histidine kinase n=1 Tax=Marinobacter albus TaxID=3030833 RepID=A0ABT7HFY4_9GAMM|nr:MULTISPECIES: HDOD domain-containing protein [unclassified Marinobacter]MBW7472723.1 HDOD domain-containing protein [Marinobacter sp. F4218]MDK9559276.1 HDOD domain-containing protein [Marinobacter sp. M216]
MDLAPDLQLPSLPEVTLRALEACHQDESYRTISEIVSVDTALVARILALANSALYRPATRITSVDQALLRLGTRRFQTLVLTAALRQLLFELGGDEWQQLRDFWRHSLTTALTARALATLTRYREPDEAFMLGMVHNIGELIAIKTPAPDAKQYFITHQSDIAAELVTAWGLGPMAADAMRYQQALPHELRDAGHLVKLISLATRLALSDAGGIAAAATVFGLSEELTREINRRISHEVSGMAASLGIPLDNEYDGETATRKLKQTILRQAMANQSLGFANLHGPVDDVLSETVNSLTLVTGLPALCFGHSDDNLVLLSGTTGAVPELAVSANPGGSVLTDAFSSGKPVSLADRAPTVLDRQLLTLLRTPSLLAVPVVTGNDRPGVFALGTDEKDPTTTSELATLFARQLSVVLEDRSQTPDADGQQDAIQQEVAREMVRRQVHEVSNPLTIIRQYIYQLRNRLEDSDVQRELDVIRDELDRAGNLLLQMGHTTTDDDAEGAELNAELKSLSRILEDSLFTDGKRQLNVIMCRQPTLLTVGAAPIRQIVINLVRNAVESLPEKGGKVEIRTSAPVWQNNRTWVELEITDTGTGIPDEIRSSLFTPVKTTKGKGHSGLGLSIVKQLIDDMEGIIACRTGQEGTAFRILLPAANHNKNETD